MNLKRSVAVLLLSLCSLRPGLAHDLEAGLFSEQAPIWGADYLTLESENILLRFDVRLETLARKVLPHFEKRLTGSLLERKTKLNRKIPIFLVARGFGNAFVMYPFLNPSFMVLPAQLTSVETADTTQLFVGGEENVLDVFDHEIRHSIEFDQLLAPWAFLFGDGPFNFMNRPAWNIEAWAVLHEGGGLPTKGRMKPSYFGALFKSELMGRKTREPSRWDFSANSIEWRLIGGHYIVGSNFFYYLSSKYGLSKVDELVLGHNTLGWASAYQNTFGRSFGELFADYTESLKNDMATLGQKPNSEIIFDHELDKIIALGINVNNEVAFLGEKNDHTSRYFKVSNSGKLLHESPAFQWFYPLVSRPSFKPLEWSERSGADKLYYFGSQSSQDNNESIPGIYLYDFSNGRERLLRELPLSRAAVVLPDQDTFFSFRQLNQNSQEFAIERASLTNKFSTRVVSTLKEFESVSQLRWIEESKSVQFSAIKAGGTWGIYQLEIRENSSPKLLVDTRGQDLFSRNVGGRLYFLSDFDAKSFQVYELIDKQLCRLTNEPYLIRDFSVDTQANIFAISRRESKDVIIKVSKAQSSCVSLSESAVPLTSLITSVIDELKPADQVAFQESAWATLIPDTRALLPRYDADHGFALQALLSGDSPYKQWGWALLGDWQDESPHDYAIAGSLQTQQFYPFEFTLNLENTPYALGKEYVERARFLNTSFIAERAFGPHTLKARAIYSSHIADEISTRDNLGSGSGFSFAHSFANLQEAYAANRPQRGWSIFTAVENNPSYFEGTAPTSSLLAQQSVYLPVTEFIFPTHSFGLHFQELKVWESRARLVGEGGPYSYGFFARSDLGQRYNLGAFVPQSLSLRGYEDWSVSGDFVLSGSAEYNIPLNFLQYGITQLFNRRWLNPETQELSLTLFYDLGYVRGTSVAFWGRSEKTLSSAGFVASWGLWTSERRKTGVFATYTFAKELDEEKKLNQNIDLTGRVIF